MGDPDLCSTIFDFAESSWSEFPKPILDQTALSQRGANCAVLLGIYDSVLEGVEP